jgi:MFS family permease
MGSFRSALSEDSYEISGAVENLQGGDRACIARSHYAMTSATVARPAAPLWTSLRLSNGIAFGLLTSILVSLLASSSAPTPLYATYQAQWGFSPVTITVIFGVYAVAVLASLLVFGSLSDHVGRRPMLLGALVVQAGVMILFATASGLSVLLAARVVQVSPRAPPPERSEPGSSTCARAAGRSRTPPARWPAQRRARSDRRCSSSSSRPEFGVAVIALAALTGAGLLAGIARRRVYDQSWPTPEAA